MNNRKLVNFRPKYPKCGEPLIRHSNRNGEYECSNKDCLVIRVRPNYYAPNDSKTVGSEVSGGDLVHFHRP